jgi:tRNA pseudouridine38-40 synthase
MPRMAMAVEYDGTDFVGWQTQSNGRSVQSTLAAAVSRVAGEPVDVHAAGRTDAGVHALAQVVHFDCRVRRTQRQWQLGINSNLPDDVAVDWVAEVPDDFDARRSATSRRYCYTIEQAARRPVLSRRYVWWLRERLDCAAMTRAAVYWLGEHDFSAFRAAQCQSRTPVRRLSAVGVASEDGRLVRIEFTANAFVYHMVRNLVGTLAEIGRGRTEPEWAAQLLASRDRRRAAPTAPACGLTLVDVGYPARFGLPSNSVRLSYGVTELTVRR